MKEARKNDSISPFREPRSAWGLVSEMNHVIWRGALSKDAMGGWANVLIQGASVEGIYRGMVLSREFRNLEEKSKAAGASTLDLWSEAVLLFKPTLDAKALRQRFQKASAFTLARVLGDEILKVNDETHAIQLIQWSQKHGNIDFGLSERNRSDLGFHRAWFQGAPEDARVWESLNRVFRMLVRDQK